MQEIFSQLRADYQSLPLLEEDLPDAPFEAFQLWFSQACADEPFEANAMTLATVDAEGRPSARIVLLKELDDQGFVFFSNYESRKGRDLAAVPRAALVFFWPRAHRQVRVEGTVELLDSGACDRYFASRPRGAQIGAWASQQSTPIGSRPELEERRILAEQRFGDDPVARPPCWGGYRVLPESMEFWQGRPDRLHDRIAYQKKGQVWSRHRLMP